MDILDLLGTFAWPLALVLPLVVWHRLTDYAHALHPPGSRRPTLAGAAGLVLGLCQLAALWDPPLLTFDAIFAARGAWDLSAPAFIAVVERALFEGPGRLLGRLMFDDPRLNYAVAVMGVTALFAVGAVQVLAARLRVAALAAFALDILVAVLSSGATVYAGHLMLWLANRLNFWVFAVLILLIQEWRYGVLGLSHRLRPPGRAKVGPHGFNGRTTADDNRH